MTDRPDARRRALEAFARLTSDGTSPSWLVRAPGRVNLIGDHTDYNDGFVLPMAIDRAAWIALRSREDRRVVLHALDAGERVEIDLDHLDAPENARGRGWRSYVEGIAGVLAAEGLPLRGWEGVLAGDVPLGAGLSSSAALELAVARAFTEAGALSWDAPRMARLAQRAEHLYAGVQCGIMDQLISALGIAGHALLIDCRSLATTPVALPGTGAVVVLDTATRRSLSDSAYNARRGECARAARALGVPSLRDASLEGLAGYADRLDAVAFRRARHVITENARTIEASRRLAAGDVAATGRLIRESHASLRDDFEVSRPELDLMVSIADAEPGCHGARVTGAGFGGCAVALVQRDVAGRFAERVAERYSRETGLSPTTYVCAAAGGAGRAPSSPSGI